MGFTSPHTLPLAALALAGLVWAQGCGAPDATEPGAGPGQPRQVVADYAYPAPGEDAPGLTAAEPPLEPVAEGDAAALRARVEELEARNAQLMRAVIADLQRENAVLRQELRQARNGSRQASGAAAADLAPLDAPLDAPAPLVAVSGGDAPGAPAANGPDAPPQRASREAGRGHLDPDSGVFYTAIASWGGASADATGSEDAAGLVCVVPADTPAVMLEAFGRSMRARYDAYGRVTVEVFDDPAAARDYYEEGASPSGDRVLLVHRNEAAGQDVIVRFTADGERLVSVDEHPARSGLHDVDGG